MAQIVCDQIFFCLSAEDIAARGWAPIETNCIAELVEDCNDDGAENHPDDFPQCVTDLGAASCDDFGAFESVANDFPASCDNLRALDTGLGIGL